jgi:hypothetical protein
MPPDDAPPSEGNGEEDEEEEGGDGDWDMSSGSGSDAFEPSDDDEDYGTPKGKGKAAAKTRRAKALEESAPAKLTPRQREAAKALWSLVKPDSSGKGGGILSRDEVKRWARDLGEMWSDAEVGLA